MSWVYRQTEARLWTVGFYDPEGDWQPTLDYTSQDVAAARAAWLNGGMPPSAAPTADDRPCPTCSGDIQDHVEETGEGPHGEETHSYRCLINELSDVISDMETCEPPVEDGWVRILKLVETAYKVKLDG